MISITSYADQYGYIVLMLALLLEMIALPVPGEVLMSYTGYMVHQGQLNWIMSILIAGIGTSIGMTISYFIGKRLGGPFLHKYGHLIHLGPKQLERTSNWFKKYGNKLLLVAYFIPGVRHITGYFAGITKLPYKTFALFAYTGGFIWVSVFISIGKLLGPQWEKFHDAVKKYLVIAGIIIAAGIILYYIYRKYRKPLVWLGMGLIHWTGMIFKSRVRAEVFIFATATATLLLIVLMITMVQNLFAGEFSDFNEVTSLIVSLLFEKHWSSLMHMLLLLGSHKVLLSVIALTVIWILWKGKDRTHEILILCMATIGGELYQNILHGYFHRVALSGVTSLSHFAYEFPNSQAIMVLIVYGYFVYLVVRHAEVIWIHTFMDILFLVILLAIAVSHIFFGLELPSNIAGGYVFGGVWLGLNILLLEIFRFL
ncbi:VTT domain-containing protein [Heyndrickxia ginsengihumi]|uniref:VTT domain-containing protein n=1 Tax=Heyndrickxia ginsengihumi TaxID=363870 RepID=UPI00046FCB3C|nr:VTT domain-containing protein [Heyndrickxia ginsengihumi]MCM3023133.1 VTT domain-containing protein [Heyndrickxia ginsengihumi]